MAVLCWLGHDWKPERGEAAATTFHWRQNRVEITDLRVDLPVPLSFQFARSDRLRVDSNVFAQDEMHGVLGRARDGERKQR